ncbi:MAG: hypothetical protein ACRC33_22355, partial [Gemmataceae bacterium]
KLTDPAGRARVLGFAARFAGHATAMVVHDELQMHTRPDDYVAAVRGLNARLEAQGDGPTLYIEYAVGLPVAAFLAAFEALRDCARVSATVDISHVGIRQCQLAFEDRHPGRDVCRLKWDGPELREHVADVQAACATANPVTVQLVGGLARVGKPVHFHLHDGHPASTFNAFGVSDHLSFFAQIPLPFEHAGGRHLPLIHGPTGLKRILDAARAHLPPESLSLTVEVHPMEGRLDLGEHAGLFAHWGDRTNAERMNFYLDDLIRCARLVREAVAG